MPKQILQDIINDFSLEKFNSFFREKSDKYRDLDERLSKYDKDIFSNSTRLGVIDFGGRTKDVAVIAVQVAKDLTERTSKKAQYDFAKNLLKQEDKYEAGIFIFYDTTGNFRFSLIYPQYQGKNRVWNNFKRFTHFVSKKLTNKTFITQIGNGNFENINTLKESFSVEKVTKEFFANYKKLFDNLTAHLNSDAYFDNFARKNGIDLNIFAKKILGQIVFIYFLQKRGWLGAEKNKPVDTGTITFLRDLYNKCESDNKNYFNDVLEYLFYDALNKRPEKIIGFYREYFDCQIPFLNGGLFEPINNYNWKQEFLNIPNKIFSNKQENGILDIFDQYNFTIDENDNSDQEVSVDPEMLGKVFENLLPENIRKGQGAFYTPREIVHYMCKESLINYLTNELGANEKTVRDFYEWDTSPLDHSDLENDEKAQKKVFTYWVSEFDELMPKMKTALQNIKIVDPACGSGAFLIGMLQEILMLRHKISMILDEKFSGYEVKKDTIQNCIYGVDIDPGAVDIAKLRLWLSIVVEHDISEIEPLPNLDYKIMQGNSLLENLIIGDSVISLNLDGNKKIDGRTKEMKNLFDTNDQSRMTLFTDEKAVASSVDQLEKLHSVFFTESDPDKKKILKTKIDSKEIELVENACKNEITILDNRIKKDFEDKKKLQKYTEQILNIKKVLNQLKKDGVRPFFPWHLHFSDVFKEKGGFDVVIGNPPYGFRDVLTNEEKIYFRKIENIEFSSGDVAELFCKKSFDNLVVKSGILSFIIPKKCTYGDSWDGWRVNYFQKYDLHFILDSGKAFDRVLLEQTAFGLAKRNQSGDIQLCFLDNKMDKIHLFARSLKEKIFKSNNTIQIYLEYFPRSIFEKIVAKSTPETLVTGDLGLGIGTEFFSDEKTEYKLLKGIDISRWQVRSHRFLKNKEKLNWNNAKRFLRAKVLCQRLIAHIENPIPHIKVTACFDSEGIIITNTLTAFKLDASINEKFWLGYLNSSLVNWFIYNFIYGRAIRGMDFYSFYIEQIPIPKISKDQQTSFIEIVDKILTITSATNYDPKNTPIKQKELEKQIDELVYKLYNLTEEEIKTIETC
ncbi:MAG: N-6 DNA methylase [Candidatus Magasanikbacteria bacterium]